VNEEIRQDLLAQVLKKKALRDQRRLSRPSNLDVFRLAHALRAAGQYNQTGCGGCEPQEAVREGTGRPSLCGAK
jgi:hypothetical protein